MLSLARTETRLGNYASAIALGRKAYRTTNDPQMKFYAAQTVAQAHTNAGNLTHAQLWLRRTRQFAPNAEIAGRIAQDYGKLRAQNPWSTSLSFGIAPTTNINGASNKTLFWDHSLLTQTALAGLRILGGFRTTYTLHAEQLSATALSMSATCDPLSVFGCNASDNHRRKRSRLCNRNSLFWLGTKAHFSRWKPTPCF